MSRAKSKTTTLASEAEAQATLAYYITLDNQLRQAQLERDDAIAEANAAFAERAAVIKPIATGLVKELHRYCDAHRDELFRHRKSINWQDATLGYRTGNPKLKLAGSSEEEIIDDFADDEMLDMFVRTTRELAKAPIIRLLTSCEPLEPDALECLEALQRHGLTVEQRETFFIDRPDMTSAGEAA